MKRMSLITLTLATALSTGCAGLHRPDDAAIAALPVVAFGQTPPENVEYVLHFPAGTPIDTPVEFSGNLFNAPDRKTLTVTPTVDIYAYKDWVSFDGQAWQDARQALDVKLDLLLPGHHHPKTGHLNLVLNRQAN